MIVDGHLDIAWNAIAEGRGFDGPPAKGYVVSRDSLRAAGVGIVFPTIYSLPKAGLRSFPQGTLWYATPHEANIIGTAQVGYYQSVGLQLLRTRNQLRSYRRSWKPGQLAAVLLMENADPIESPAQLAQWLELGVRIIGPAWMRSRYCGGSHSPGGLTPLGRRLLAEMEKRSVILDLSHMADRSLSDSLETWHGALCATHNGARALNPGQRQLPDRVIAEVGRRDGIVGVSFYSGHLRAQGKATVADLVRHLRHFADVTGDPRHVAIGSDLDGGFGKDGAAINDTSGYEQLRKALTRQFNPADVEGIMGGNWLRFLEASLPENP